MRKKKFIKLLNRQTDIIEEEEEALIEFNRQREKTFTQRMKESEHLTEIERERAKARQSCGQGGVLLSPTLDEAKQGRSDAKVPEKIGMKKTTFQKTPRTKTKRYFNDVIVGTGRDEALIRRAARGGGICAEKEII